MKTKVILTICILQLSAVTVRAENNADSTANFIKTMRADDATSTSGLLTPTDAGRLWGFGSIPSVDHLKTKLSGRRKDDFCGNEYKSLKRMQSKSYATQVPKTEETLWNAVKQFKITRKMLDKTLAVFLQNQSFIPNQRYLTIFDHTQPSTAKRFVVLDLWNGTAKGYRSSHGSGSDPRHTGRAQKFGNDPRGYTKKSSVGCALAVDQYKATKKTRQEPKGRWALAMLGFESSNDNTCDRGIYMHAAPYVDYQKDERGKPIRGSLKGYASKPGRSWGCPAFTYAERDEVFNKISGGGLVCSWGS